MAPAGPSRCRGWHNKCDKDGLCVRVKKKKKIGIEPCLSLSYYPTDKRGACHEG
jgi:hypothetical protein